MRTPSCPPDDPPGTPRLNLAEVKERGGRAALVQVLTPCGLGLETKGRCPSGWSLVWSGRVFANGQVPLRKEHHDGG